MAGVLRLMSRRGEPSKRTRRILVVAAAAGILGLGAAMMTAPSVALPAFIIAVAVLVLPLYALSEFRRNVFHRTNADERERERRNDAYRTSYRIVEVGVLLVALLFAFATELERIPGWDWGTVWFVSFSYVLFLPYMIFAWLEPDAAD